MITEPFIKDLKSHLCKERWLFSIIGKRQNDEMAKNIYKKIEQITEKYENF